MRDFQLQYNSKTLGRTIAIRCLVPNGDNFKCLFLLHGYNGDQNQWCDKSTISLLADQYGFAVVMPYCGNGYYENTQEDIPHFIGCELVSFIQKSLPVSNKREDTFIAGVSMGGFGALLIGAKFTKAFSKIVSLSGAFIIPDVVIGNQGVLGNADPQYFKQVFGDFETLEGSNRDPIAETIRASKNPGLPSICLLCGTEDDLYECNWKAVECLRKHGIPVIWYGGRGNHRWPFWNDVLPYVINWLLNDYVPDGACRG